MWLAVVLGCLSRTPNEPVDAPVESSPTAPEQPPVDIAEEATLGWIGAAIVVPGASWVGVEQQVALDASGERLCEYTWASLDVASALPEVADATPQDCADAEGNPCEWQMTIALVDGEPTGALCRTWFGSGATPDGGVFSYGWIADWRDETSHGPWLLQRVDEAWLPVDPAAVWDPLTGSLSYFVTAGTFPPAE